MKIRIIPRLDIKGPNLVKTIFYEGLRIMGDPKKYIKQYYSDGADEIILNDIVASLYKRKFNYNLISEIKKEIHLPLCVGGGLSNINDIENCLSAGADKIFINTHGIKDNNFLSLACNTFGSSTISLNITCNYYNNDYYCITHGGKNLTNLKVTDWIIKGQDLGVGEIIITSIDHEGRGNGFDENLYKKISKYLKVPLIVTGGFGEIRHMNEILKIVNVSGFALSSSIHYNYLKKNLDNIKKSKFTEGNLDYINNHSNYFNGQLYDLKQILHEIENDYRNS